MVTAPLQAPFPYFGAKSRIAAYVWERLGDVPVYVEPFFGSGAVLLARPHAARIETVNDLDGLLANVWRAIRADPANVARYADDIVSEVDLHARHAWLVRTRHDLTERLMADPDWYDVRAAGWWVWGASCWIGSGWCSGRGPWQVADGRLVKQATGVGVERKRPHLMHTGKGLHRKVPQMGDRGRGLQRAGVPVQVPHLGDAAPVLHRPDEEEGRGIAGWLSALAARLRRVRICCGDWARILGPAGTVHQGTTGVFLDPPYRQGERDSDVYAVDQDVWGAVRDWAAAHGDDPRYRIVLAGYADDPGTVLPAGWTWHQYRSAGGYGSQGTGRGRENAGREVVWCSPHCMPPLAHLPLFRQASEDEAW